jgi:hypothetical protein
VIDGKQIMAQQHLVTYLNDHLAGSVAALEMMTKLEAEHPGTALAYTIASVRSEIEEEQQVLEGLIERFAITPQRTRQAVAWLGEKVTQVKLRLDDPSDGALRLFETLEAIAIGIQGKQSLWRALETIALPELQGIDFARFVQQSRAQHAQVEALRLEAAKTAFGDV